jgi:protein-S-isoprenylcysteine O-methyltransferase Ste14
VQKKTIFLSAVGGAVLGAAATRLGGYITAFLPAFRPDSPLLAHQRYFYAVIPWVLFSLYWEVAGRNAAEAKSSESGGSRAFHVTLTNLALLLEIAPIRGFGRFLPLSSFTLAAGLAIELLGLFLTIWARRDLGRNWSGKISIKVDHELVRSGAYRILRHPIYTGLLAMYIGAAIVTGERLALVGLTVAVFAYWRKIRLEETNLREAFGDSYDAYRRDTWALMPGIY